MSAKTPLSGDELRNTLHLDILHDTNVSDRHIEKLADLIEQEATKRVEERESELYGMGVDKFVRTVLMTHGKMEFSDDLPTDTCLIRVPRDILSKYATGELSSTKAGDAD